LKSGPPLVVRGVGMKHQSSSGGSRGQIEKAPSSEAGATAVEYAIMAALIAAVIIGAVMALGLTTEGLFADLIDRWQ
jgi:Flp pilus assembly pilin Flp